MEDRQDTIDSELGPAPNKEMTFALDIRQALFQLSKPKEKDFFTGMPFSAKSNGNAYNFDNDPPII